MNDRARQIDCAIKNRDLKQRLDFRAKANMKAVSYKRLYTEPVTGKQEALVARVPDGESKHAI